MPTTSKPAIKIVVPNTTIQQMCNFVAVAETQNQSESLRELILHTLFTFETEKISNAKEVANILKSVFGVEAPSFQVQEALDQLISSGQVQHPLSTNYILTSSARLKVKNRIDESANLQIRVKKQWLEEINKLFPLLNADLIWSALQDYLAKAFLRHGIQVAVFLDPAVKLPQEYTISLSTLLSEAVNAKFDSDQQDSARHVVSDFLASVGKDHERAMYIAECANGAANYFSLAVSQDVAEKFRQELSQLTLFCDTNFLFGILDLHVHPLVDVSNELLEAINTNKLPIKLRYHEATLRELHASISYYGEILQRHRWTQALSRAASKSRFMSGVELKYHQKNAETGVDVDAFLRPYLHVDVLLKDHKISIYKPLKERLIERSTLENEYREYLKRHGRDKVYEVISHDVAVLDCARFLRSGATSTLEAGALFVTCDYNLYRFDSDTSRDSSSPATVVLPNVLWQILRPYVPSNSDFDRSFAETFAIPEFRTIGSGAAKACSKMLGILAVYKDFPEKTAAKLLSNDMLIDRLRNVQNDAQFQEQIESAIALENQILLEEQVALAKQVEVLRADKAQTEKKILEQKDVAAAEAIKAQAAIRAKKIALDDLAASHRDAEAKTKDASAKLAEMLAAKTAAEKKARHGQLVLSAIKRSILVGSILIIVELIIGYLAWQNGEGHNLFQKLTNAWPWLGAGFGAVVILYPFIMGRDRMRLLKWWKGETDQIEAPKI
jgi:hypothetical protein